MYFSNAPFFFCNFTLTELIYKDSITKISEKLQPLTGWSLIEELNRDEADSNINRTDYAQPAIFAMQV
jgi:hybrid polyketide synthase/nonribosomal peptide synthetase FtdB